MSAKILVTGATGTVGSALIKELSIRNINVRAGFHTKEKTQKIEAPNVELVQLSYDNQASFGPAFEGIEKVILITPFVENQADIAAQLIDAAKISGVDHIIRLSAGGSDVVPGITLGRWHRTSERYLMLSGMKYTIIRPSFYMQNLINYYPPVDNKIYLPVGNGKASYIDARDIAKFIASIVSSPVSESQTFYLTGGESLTMREMAGIFSDVLRTEIKHVDISEEDAKQAMIVAGTPSWAIKAQLELNAIVRMGFAGQISNTFSEITEEKPITFRQFVQDFADCFTSAPVQTH